MIQWLFDTLRQYPELAIFLSLALGYYFGKFTFKGIGLGAVTATLIAGVVIGQIGITINVVLMVLNLFPLPPLDGGRIAVSLLPGRLAWRFAMLEPYGFIILLMLMFTGVLGVVLSPFVGLVTQVLTVVFNLR